MRVLAEAGAARRVKTRDRPAEGLGLPRPLRLTPPRALGGGRRTQSLGKRGTSVSVGSPRLAFDSACSACLSPAFPAPCPQPCSQPCSQPCVPSPVSPAPRSHSPVFSALLFPAPFPALCSQPCFQPCGSPPPSRAADTNAPQPQPLARGGPLGPGRSTLLPLNPRRASAGARGFRGLGSGLGLGLGLARFRGSARMAQGGVGGW